MDNERSRMLFVRRLGSTLCLAMLPTAMVAADRQGQKAAAARADADSRVWALDSDGDGVADLVEALYHTSAFEPADRPSIDLQDADSDGVPDATERAHGTDPNEPDSFPIPELPDSDGDAVPDAEEILIGRDPLGADESFTDCPLVLCEPRFADGQSLAFRRSDARANNQNRMCIQVDANSGRRYHEAQAFCMDRASRVCSYEDFFTRTSMARATWPTAPSDAGSAI